MMLQNLPPELLSEITSYLPTARAVSHLAKTCRALHTFVKKEGWRVFVQSRFPSIPVTCPEWRDAAHALTNLSRNWDRKAILARYVEPAGHITVLPSGGTRQRWRRPRGQTMGFQPVIDSYEEWTGSGWADRKEVLAYSAGAELVLRIKEGGSEARRQWKRSSAAQRDMHFTSFQQKVDWICYNESCHAEGRDDITFLNLLRPPQWRGESGHGEHILVGRANGELALLSAQLNSVSSSPILKTYVTNGRQVRSGNISPASVPLMATCLSDNDIAIYQVHAEGTAVEPVSEANVVPERKSGCRTWSTRFLSPDRLAIGLGPSKEPVRVFQVTPSGLSTEPVRTFGSYCTEGNQQHTLESTVYPIAAIGPSLSAGGGPGDLFLSGGYDGIVRLHDVRSPSLAEMSYWDQINFDPVYALQLVGRERFIVGSARYSLLNVFDLRMSGGRAYHYLDAAASATSTIRAEQNGVIPHSRAQTDSSRHPQDSRRFCLFLNPKNYDGPANRNDAARSSHDTWRRRHHNKSPVYSLSSPSASSTSLFAGIEGDILQLDIASTLDAHPDPVFAFGFRRKGREVNVKKTWDPKGDVLDLHAYEDFPRGVYRVCVQGQVGNGTEAPGTEAPGWDKRWQDHNQFTFK